MTKREVKSTKEPENRIIPVAKSSDGHPCNARADDTPTERRLCRC